ncbi:hypothetical protein CA13_09880 [Planctomycetes bacterium CA13]|uniref:Uncharacterized protein n=1 Tax=Novipirellula herctigrandis TaxID=2527986 RepID=A0A5C5YX26_9BACT|nr:hypothetical protein CA13_09880 [Planctomycetes bacterium CA13]
MKFNTKQSGRGKSSLGAIGIVVLVGIYSFAQPVLNDRYGLNLPALRSNQAGQGAVAEVSDNSSSLQRGETQTSEKKRTASKPSSSGTANSATVKQDSAKSGTSQPGMSERARGPLADRMSPTKSGAKSATVSPASSSSRQIDAKQVEGAGDSDLLYGLLREVSPKRYMSPAGLQYVPGSAEGHRLEHLRRHTKDNPSRAGSHGVFDGEMEGALKTIDKAYERAKKGTRTTKRTDDGRTIYTVDMGGRIGYVGGRDGNRKRKPMARRVRMVLEGTRVITAYPM